MRSLLENLRCTACGNMYPDEMAHQACDDCRKPLEAVYNLRPHAVDPAEWDARGVYMWRYRELLPLRSARHLVTLGEGCTPLRRMEGWERPLRLRRVYVKDESFNPTGSFKDRGMSVIVSKAKEMGATDICLASAGNAGVSAAAYAAVAGLKAHIFMPSDTPRAFFKECDHYGADVHSVDGTIDIAAMTMQRDPDCARWYNVSTFRQPYRMEGKKTMAYEIWEQLDGALPDAIIFPTGGGVGIVAMWQAFKELDELGLLQDGRKPRLIAAQAEGCAPLVKAFKDKAPAAEHWENAETMALGLRVPASMGDYLVLMALRESDGFALAVSDYEIRQGMREMSRALGTFAGPESGAALAALKRLQGAGKISPKNSVLLFSTGGGGRYVDLL